MKIKFAFNFGKISEAGYRHFPIIYLANGKDGFSFTIFGLSTIIKLW